MTKRLTKNLNISFVKKCAKKAEEAIDNKYNGLLEQLQEQFYKEAGYMEQINTIESEFNNLLNRMYGIITRTHADSKARLNSSHYGSYYEPLRCYVKRSYDINSLEEDKILFKLDKVSIRDSLYRMITPQTDEFIALEKEHTKAITNVRNEYNKLKTEIHKMTPTQGKKYLESLGFDTSWINNQLIKDENSEALDPSKLFVCGTKGVEETKS